MNKVDTDKYHVGHRKRLKEKFLSTSHKSFPDYEILELLLFYSIPRRDVKPLAKSLLEQFGNLKNLINANDKKILAIQGMNENIVMHLHLIKELLSRTLYEPLRAKDIISSWSALLDYLKFDIGNVEIEKFRILFLDKKNQLIADKSISEGTIDQIRVYPREIIKLILFHEAVSIILVHNHPSGNVEPSTADINLTKNIVEACNMINVSVHDHVIVGNNNYYSFKSNMLL